MSGDLEAEREGDAVADRRVHPATIPLRFVKEAPQTLLGLPAGYAFISDQGLWQVLLFAAFIAALAIVYQWLAWQRFRYGFGARDLVIESGILSRTRRLIPFDRIQDVDIERGPLARIFGLAKLRIETGGSGGDEGVLDSVTVAEAERIRSVLRARRSGATAGAEAGAEPERPLLFAMGVPRVLATGVFNFSMVYLASLFALLQTFERWLPFDIYDPARWIGFTNAQLGGRFSFTAIAAVALLAVLLGSLTGIVRTLTQDYGFRLTLEGEGFRRVRGLFTRSEVLIPRRRIQLAMLGTGPFRRLLGCCSLTFQTLSTGRPGDGGQQSVAPLARPAELEPILAPLEEFRIADPSELTPVSSRHFLRRMIGHLWLPLLAVAVGVTTWRPALIGIVLLPLLAVLAQLERRFHRYGLSGGLLFVTRGVWRQRQWVVPVRRIQSLRLSRTWLQRRLGLASLAIDTAGAPVLSMLAVVDLWEADACALAASLRPGGA